MLLLGRKSESIAEFTCADVPVASNTDVDVLCDVAHVAEHGLVFLQVFDLLLEEAQRYSFTKRDVSLFAMLASSKKVEKRSLASTVRTNHSDAISRCCTICKVGY